MSDEEIAKLPVAEPLYVKPISVEDIREMPDSILDLLYKLRFLDDVAVPYGEYVARFDFVVVDDDIIYHDWSESSKWREKQYLKARRVPESMKCACIPSVIIKNGIVVKNRFGHTSYG